MNKSNSKDKSFFMQEAVKTRKDNSLKSLCEAAIVSCGLSNQEFYQKANISRQQWYLWSWGLEPFPSWLKVRLVDLFGKPFRDLFLSSKFQKEEIKNG